MNTMFFDTGTTNTRAYLLNDGTLIDSAATHVGARNSAMSNSATMLEETIRSLYFMLLDRNSLSTDDIDSIYMSGMASSPDGIREIPHLELPVSINQLRNSMVFYTDTRILPQPIQMIPGIRTRLPHGIPAAPEDAVGLQMIRGEETEVAGIMDSLDAETPYIVVLPGSHTQMALIHNNHILDFFSGITGEIRSAMLNDSILQASLSLEGPDHLDPDYAELGYKTLHVYGFNHALYGVRTLSLFSDTTDSQRQSYFQGVLTGGMVDGMLNRALYNGWHSRNMIVTGRVTEYEAYQCIMGLVRPAIQVEHYDAGDVPLAVRGCITVAGLKDDELVAQTNINRKEPLLIPVQ